MSEPERNKTVCRGCGAEGWLTAVNIFPVEDPRAIWRFCLKNPCSRCGEMDVRPAHPDVLAWGADLANETRRDQRPSTEPGSPSVPTDTGRGEA